MLAKIPRTARLKRILASDCGSSLHVIFQLDLDLFGFKKELSSVDFMPGRITVFLCNPSIFKGKGFLQNVLGLDGWMF